MIASLRGVVCEQHASYVNVEVGGVGYRVIITTSDSARLTRGEVVFLHVHTIMRESSLSLYGFLDGEARNAFEVLLSAHGVGPSLAMAILSVHSPSSLRRAIATGDSEALALVPGVGRKTSARLLLELSGSLGQSDETLSAESRGGDLLSEVASALSGLGYGPEEVREAIRGLPPEGSLEDLLRSALRLLGAGR